MFRAIIVLCFINSLSAIDDENWAQNKSCGLMSLSVSLIQGGSKSERETFPWLANIFTKYSGSTLYAGSGSLVSDRHILCAANSVAYENYLEDSLDLNPEQNYIAYDGENVKVILGSSHYKMLNEPGIVTIDGAKKIVLHPSLAGTKPRVHNVALIFLKEPVAFNKFMSPVCLQSFNEIYESFLGKTVFSVGFGVDQTGSISGIKRHMAMVTIDDETCKKFYKDTMERGSGGNFFCARGNGIETPCRYDKPLYVKIDDRWFLLAMSSTFKVFKNRLCRPRAPVLYEDVTSFTEWIESEISQE